MALLTNRSVFAAGVQELLQGVHGMALSVIDAADPAAMKEITRLKPHVVVLDTDDEVGGRASVVQILEIQPHARVVTLNLSHPGIDVFRMERVAPTDLAGLVRAIQGPNT
ncbi:MAG: hypothetical protein HY682_06050 [Chloroflexi bacterium]|nr:hypothetical protein [Chloroflexota bacterium]